MTSLVDNVRISGTVVHGEKLGSRIGVPTANINISKAYLEESLSYGVYAVVISMESGKKYNGIANFGVKPTFNSEAPSLEVHIFDFSDEIYGRTVSIEFKKFVRSEISFESIQYLTEQIESDIKLVREFFFNESNHFLTED